MALAALIVKIGGDLTGLNRALTQADKDVVRVGKKLEKLGGSLTQNLTVPIVAAGAALMASAIHAGEFADKLLDLVDMTGLSSDALQEFRHVALVAGVEADTLADAAIKLTTKLSAGDEQTKAMTDALGRLGLSATGANGRLVSMDQLLPGIIGKLQGMKDVTLRNTIAADIFGKSWAELAPIMGLGAGAMEKARKEARALGLVMSEDALEAANNFRIKLDTLKASMGAVTREIGMAVLPIMEKLVGFLQKDVVPAIRNVVKWFDDLSPAAKGTIAGFAGLLAVIGPLVAVLGTVMTFLPLIGVAFVALTGPIGVAILAVTALTHIGLEMIKEWDYVKLRFLLLWKEIQGTFFTAVQTVIAGMVLLTKNIPFVGAKVLELSLAFDAIAAGGLAKTDDKIGKLADKMGTVAVETTRAAVAIYKLGAAIHSLPSAFAATSKGLSQGIFADPKGPFVFTDEMKQQMRDRIPTPGTATHAGSRLGDAVGAGMGGSTGGQIAWLIQAFGPLAAIVPIVSGAMEALEPVLTSLIQPLVQIGQLIGGILAPVLKSLSVVISYVMEAFGWLVRGVGKLIDSLPFVSAHGIIDAGQAMIDAAKAARKNAGATDEATDGLNKFSSALSNIPRVLNLNLLRHMLGGTGGSTRGSGGTSGGTGTGGTSGSGDGDGFYNYGTVNIIVPGAGDPDAVANKVAASMTRKRLRGGISGVTLAVVSP